jgi:lysophospholipase L1-like esterase
MALLRFPNEVQDNAPDIVVIQFGLNDCNCWETDKGLPRVSEAAYEANFREMVTRARHFGVREIILSTNHVTLRHDVVMPGGEIYESANSRYSDIVRKVAMDCDVTLCDIRKEFEKFSKGELADLLLPQPDVLHLSIKGNAFYADMIWPYVKLTVDRVIESKGISPAEDASIGKGNRELDKS